MANLFNLNIISEILMIEEKMLKSLKKISCLYEISDVNIYISEINKLKVFYSKENYLISKIPNDTTFLDYIFSLIKNPDNFDFLDFESYNIVVSRFSNIMHTIYSSLEDEYELYDSSIDDDYTYDMENFIRTNYLIQYILSFNGLINQSNDSRVSKIFTDIQLFNVFINKNLFNMWVNSDFNFNQMSYMSDNEMMSAFGLNLQTYENKKNSVLVECCTNLLSEIFNDVDNPKKNVVVQDAFFNLKFLLTKVPTEYVMSIKNEFEKVYDTVGSYGLLLDLLVILDDELSVRDDISSKSSDDNLLSKSDMLMFDKVVQLIKVEDCIFDSFNKIDFENSSNDIERLASLVDYEKEVVKDINLSLPLLPIINDVLKSNIWIYLNSDDEYKISPISQRISNILPIYKDFKVLPSQSEKEYNLIYKNHLIRCLNDFWKIGVETSDLKIRNGFIELYKLYFFVNPSLTDEFIAAGGNHLLLCDLNDNLVSKVCNVDMLEYNYDKNEQLYNLGCNVLSSIIELENKVDTISDYVNFQFKIDEVIDIINNLDDEYINKLYIYLNENSSFFSPLRRDLRKIFKDYMYDSKTKSKKKGF